MSAPVRPTSLEPTVALGERYTGRRSAMVVDAVLSVGRDHALEVAPRLARFARTPAARCLAALAEGLGVDDVLLDGHLDEARAIAAGLARYGREHTLSDDDACRAWAASAEPHIGRPGEEPYVGAEAGIGPAAFAYLRLLCGAGDVPMDV